MKREVALIIDESEIFRSRRNRESSVLCHLPLVRRLAYRMSLGSRRVEVEDLVSAGTIGLIQAADRYDATVGVPFVSFAYPRISGAIVDELRKSRRASAADGEPVEPLSLAEPFVDGERLTLGDVLVDPSSPSPDAHAELGELLDAIEDLPARDREMLRLSTAGHTAGEIAEEHGCSLSRAAQILARARLWLEDRTAA